jgi:prepilin-type processing-associated H-X9-DG protein
MVEVLVVIGVIAILMGLVMPVIVAARRDAQSIRCREQMRQLGMAFQMYASGNKGRLMHGGFLNQWHMTILPENKWWPTTLCPTGERDEWVSYLYNGYLGMIGHNLNLAPRAHALSTDIILLGEKRLMHGMHWRFPDPASYVDQVDPLRHGRRLRANYLYLDFHVEGREREPLINPNDSWDIMRPYEIRSSGSRRAPGPDLPELPPG